MREQDIKLPKEKKQWGQGPCLMLISQNAVKGGGPFHGFHERSFVPVAGHPGKYTLGSNPSHVFGKATRNTYHYS